MPGGLQSFPGDLNVQGNLFVQGTITTPGGGSGAAFPLLAPDGTLGAPPYAFANEPGLGWYRESAAKMTAAVNGTRVFSLEIAGPILHGTAALQWGSSADTAGDLTLFRDAADTLAQRRGTNAQIFRCYKTTAGTAWIGFDTADAAAPIIKSTFAMANNAAAAAGTLNNAPAAGNPTKWIPISDNGTIRNIPAW